MFARRTRMRQAVRSILAVIGLLLMIASFVWMQRTSQPQPARLRVAQPSATPRPFAVVVLDPGHGGQDSGAMCAGMLEKNLTLDVAHRVDRLLEAEGIATVMTRLGDTYVSLADRATFANRVSDCIFISIHFNEDNQPVASGVETFYAAHQMTPGSFVTSWLPSLLRALPESPNVESQSLAGFIPEALVACTPALDRGTKEKQLFVIENLTAH